MPIDCRAKDSALTIYNLSSIIRTGLYTVQKANQVEVINSVKITLCNTTYMAKTEMIIQDFK